MSSIRSVPLTDTAATTVILACLVVGVLLCVRVLRHRPRSVVKALTFSVLSALLSWLAFGVMWNPWPGEVPHYLYALVGAWVLALLSLIFQRGRLVTILVACGLIAVSSLGLVNLAYHLNPTVGSLDPRPDAVRMTLSEFQATTSVPTAENGVELGALVTLPFTGPVSHFPARNAQVYVPPGYWTRPDVRLPVVILMAGSPGEPGQWFGPAEADDVTADFAAAHDGLAPLIVSVDATATFSGNPVCVDSSEYKVMTYLIEDVPSLITSTFHVNPDRSTWTIGGLSYGGTCALQVITTHPHAYGAFLNFSGQAEPSIGTRQETVDKFFGSDEQAFLKQDPATLLERAAAEGSGIYQGIPGRFVAGKDAHDDAAALKHLYDLAQRAGMDVDYSTVPGAHTFEVWRVAFAESLDFVAHQGGLV